MGGGSKFSGNSVYVCKGKIMMTGDVTFEFAGRKIPEPPELF